ncbi:hypothetical protein MHF_0563 [Mycoplasma haemofelis Ohio2]|uniref:Uncharacterized protein n=1 Tax=Mycoplasma haemofelis (strain Ohio2) TaxID=859194 RepID=F6FHY7_MYCHI|nr:hypothetical protein MHF_0563 [Mycoplasma haemofelis Ohio2]
MRLLSALALLGFGTVGVGGWYGFSTLRPKNLQQYLEWQGFELASKTEGNIWKSILDERKEIIKSRIGKTDPQESDIRNWCSSHLSISNYESFKDDASKICVNNPHTVRAKIILQDGSISSLIEGLNDSKGEKYKVAYIFRKHIEGVPELIGFIPPSKEEGTENLEGGGKALGEWCQKSLESKSDDQLVKNVRLLCSPRPFTTIKELIKLNKEEELLLTEEANSTELSKKYAEIKDKDSWTKESSSPDSQESLKKWCQTHESKKFSEEGTFSNVYPKFRFRCMKSRS